MGTGARTTERRPAYPTHDRSYQPQGITRRGRQVDESGICRTLSGLLTLGLPEPPHLFDRNLFDDNWSAIRKASYQCRLQAAILSQRLGNKTPALHRTLRVKHLLGITLAALVGALLGIGVKALRVNP